MTHTQNPPRWNSPFKEPCATIERDLRVPSHPTILSSRSTINSQAGGGVYLCHFDTYIVKSLSKAFWLMTLDWVYCWISPGKFNIIKRIIYFNGSIISAPPLFVTGQPVLIGGTMGTCSYVLTGMLVKCFVYIKLLMYTMKSKVMIFKIVWFYIVFILF